MWLTILGALSSGLSILNKWLKSWDWKGGEASEKAKQAEVDRDAREAMEDVDRPSEPDVIDRLRDGEF